MARNKGLTPLDEIDLDEIENAAQQLRDYLWLEETESNLRAAQSCLARLDVHRVRVAKRVELRLERQRMAGDVEAQRALEGSQS